MKARMSKLLGKYWVGRGTMLKVNGIEFIVVTQNDDELRAISELTGVKTVKKKLFRSVGVFSLRRNVDDNC